MTEPVPASARRCEQAFLTIADVESLILECEDDLHAALERLAQLRSGEEVRLARGDKHYIEAVRWGDLWSVTTRNGGYLTLASFTAGLTTDYSDREAKADRAAGSIWNRIKRSISSPSPERALSTAQVRTLFAEFLSRKTFTIPQSGA